jgi:hypothetical protein
MGRDEFNVPECIVYNEPSFLTHLYLHYKPYIFISTLFCVYGTLYTFSSTPPFPRLPVSPVHFNILDLAAGRLAPLSTPLAFSPFSPVHFINLDLAPRRPGLYSPSVFTHFTGSFHHFRPSRWAARPLLPQRFHPLYWFISSFWT